MEQDQNGGTNSTPTDAGPSLADSLGSMFGDYVQSDVPDSPSDANAGTPPADASAATSEEGTTDAVEGSTDAAEPTGAPPADAAAQEPDQVSADAPGTTVDDPLKDATPFGYTVDGQSRTLDGIHILKDGESVVGAIVDADFLPKLERIVGERDHLFEKQQAQHQQYADLERLTQWQIRTGQDAQGQPIYSTLTGAKALEAQRVMLSSALAERMELHTALKDADTIASLIAGVDEAGNLVLNPIGVRNLETRVENARLKAMSSTREHFAQFSAPQPVAPPPETPTAQLAMPTIEAFATQHQVTGLTPEDKAQLASQFEFYVRKGEDGQRVVDPKFLGLMQHTAALRATSSKQVQSATDAAKQNAEKLRAASAGKTRTTAPKTPVAPKVTPTNEREKNSATAWEINERAAAANMRHRVGSSQ